MSLSTASGSKANGNTAGGSASSAVLTMLKDRGIQLPTPFSRLRIRELRAGHRQPVRGLGWSVDGRKLATCGADRVVRIWVPERSIDHRASTELRGHTESVDQLVWHPLNPDILATASADKTVRIWDTRVKPSQSKAQSTSTPSTSGPGSSQVVSTPGANINIAYHPSGNFLAVGDKTDTVSIIDTRLGKIIHTVCSRQSGPPTSATASSSNAGFQTIWSSPDEVNELCWSPNGELLVLSSGTGAIHLHSTTDYARVHTIIAHTANVFCLQWDPYSRYVASASSDSMISLWDSREWFSHKMITTLSAPARSVSFSHDGELIAAGGEDPFICINATSPYPPASDDLIHKIQLPPDTMINTLAWHPTKYVLAYAGDDAGKDVGTVRIFGL